MAATISDLPLKSSPGANDNFIIDDVSDGNSKRTSLQDILTSQNLVSTGSGDTIEDADGNTINTLALNQLNTPNAQINRLTQINDSEGITIIRTYNEAGTSDENLVTFSVPNEDLCVLFDVIALNTRTPITDVGVSNFEHSYLVVGRTSGSNVVLDKFKQVDQNTADAGGSNSCAVLNITLARTGSESASSPQDVAIQAHIGTSIGATAWLFTNIRTIGSHGLI